LFAFELKTGCTERTDRRTDG